MRIAVAGKGGSGKTTIAGTMARLLARGGLSDVLAIDADSNPNLALTLGIPRETAAELVPIGREVLERITDAEGKTRLALNRSADEIAKAFSVSTPDDVHLLLMGRVDHAGRGCMCGPHAAVRSLLGELIGLEDRPTVVDIEAGLEHLSRGTAKHVDLLLVVVEPYFKSMETGVRIERLARELGIQDVWIVANKLRGELDEADVSAFLQTHGLAMAGAIPEDECVHYAERRGLGLLDVSASSPAIHAIEALGRHVSAAFA